MKTIVLLLLGLFLFASVVDASDDKESYSQSYTILIKGEAAGSENVKETRGASGELISTSEHEIFVSDGLETKRMAFSTKMVLAKSTMEPKSYSFQYTTEGIGDSYEVHIEGGQVHRTLNRKGQTSSVSVPWQPNMVILDVNVYHLYDYVIPKYNMKKKGRQVFADFQPVIGTDIPLALTYLGDENLEYKQNSISVKHFRMELVNRTGTVSVDKDGRLIRLLIPSQDLQVMRTDLLF
jgi:hypothetical protein